jgi:hypothetical protein
MRRIALIALVLLSMPGCGTLTVVRYYGLEQPKPTVKYSYHHHKGWARDIINSYRFHPQP